MDLNLFLGCERVQNHLPGQWTFANTTRIQMERTHVRCYGNVAPPEGVAVRKHPRRKVWPPRHYPEGIKSFSPVLVRQHLHRVFVENQFNPVRVE